MNRQITFWKYFFMLLVVVFFVVLVVVFDRQYVGANDVKGLSSSPTAVVGGATQVIRQSTSTPMPVATYSKPSNTVRQPTRPS
ncbi:MAG: hypothetical protein WCP97_08365 [bacterium]